MNVPKFSYLPHPNASELQNKLINERSIKWIQYHHDNTSLFFIVYRLGTEQKQQQLSTAIASTQKIIHNKGQYLIAQLYNTQQSNIIIEALEWHLEQEAILSQEIIKYALKAHLNPL